jgi:putative transposase
VSEVTYYRWRQEFGGLKIEQVKRLKELELENSRLRKAVSDLTLDKLILQEASRGKLLSPARRRACIEQVRAQLHVSERRACAALGQHRSTQRKVPRGRADEECLTADIIELARQYGRYGYRKIAELLRQAGWTINDKRVERIWQPTSNKSVNGANKPPVYSTSNGKNLHKVMTDGKATTTASSIAVCSRFLLQGTLGP